MAHTRAKTDLAGAAPRAMLEAEVDAAVSWQKAAMKTENAR
jgi:hypothetical protein